MHPVSPDNFRGKRVTVMGLGSFGGGLGAVQFLLDRGAQITLTDLRTREELTPTLEQIDPSAVIEYRFGAHRNSDFTNADLIVVNPAVPQDSPYLNMARDAGVPTTSEMNLFWQFNRGRTIGITGSNGKSTTTGLIHSILKAAGRRCWLGGNIGNSLLPVVDEIQSDDWVVLELSSFQLDELNPIQASPEVAVVTNFSPNHLDRHGTLDNYRAAKQTILRWQTDGQIAVLNSDVKEWPTTSIPHMFGAIDSGHQGVFHVSDRTIIRSINGETSIDLQDWLPLPGEHNLANAMAAVAATSAIGIDLHSIQLGIERFRALPHRLEFLGEIDGRRFYNDSLATTPESAIAAIESFDRPVVLLAGGYDKQVDLSTMADAINERVKAVALMGATGPLIGRLISDRSLPHRVCKSLQQAFDWAVDQSSAGDNVLLSPGCASYDWFDSFVDRGQQFARLVEDLASSPRGECAA